MQGKPILFTSLMMLSPFSMATVGGPETIEVLGYDQKDQKIFLIRQYHDQFGHLPQLYYYQLNSRTPQKLIEVKSIYKHLDKKLSQAEKQLQQELKKIQTRLIPLESIPVSSFKVQKLKQKVTEGDFWQYNHPDDAFILKKYEQTYQVCSQHASSLVLSSTSYINPSLHVSNAWQIPNRSAQLAIVEYQGINMESGYSKQDASLLLPQTAKSKTTC
ncbi:aminotransferase [Acinetobacter thermotolerans]|uniref:aminotransferase n=2 Tax=Acinetobacter thermotolerans TaxID=3151487 RepID=UPI00325A6BB8